MTGFDSKRKMAQAKLEQQAEPPPEWLLIKNILDAYGLDAIAFVTAWKAVQQRAEPVAQRQWVGLTDEEIVAAIDPSFPFKFNLAMIAFVRNIEAKLKEKNA